MALIESLLKRKNGTTVRFGNSTYHFKPDDKGRHVATVTDESHVKALLAIPEGYALADGSKAPANTQPTNDNGGQGQSGSTIGVRAGEGEGDGKDEDPDSDLEKARAEYVAKFHKKPHHTWSVEVIRQKLAED